MISESEVRAADRHATRAESQSIVWLRQLDALAEKHDERAPALPSREALAEPARAARHEANSLKRRFEAEQRSKPLTTADIEASERAEAAKVEATEARKVRQRVGRANASALKVASDSLDDQWREIAEAYRLAGEALRRLHASAAAYSDAASVAILWARAEGLEATDDMPDGVEPTALGGRLAVGGRAHSPIDPWSVLAHMIITAEVDLGHASRVKSQATAVDFDGRLASLR